MFYYAQIKNGVVMAITQTAGSITAADMVPIEGLLDITGHTYNATTGEFSAPAVSSIPTRVPALSALLALDAAGLSGAYEAWASAPERTFADRAFISKAQFWNRDDPTLLAAAASLGLTEENIDALFSAAAQM